MKSTLTWLDLTSGDRDKLRRVLDLFREKGTIDELGLGSLRDMFSEALFPGLNTLQTRLRYALFIPWIYKSLESRGASANETVELVARNFEIRLIKALAKSEDSSGNIGIQAQDSLVRLPSNIYWGALKRWGIFKGQESQVRYHKNNRAHEKGLAEDDPGLRQVHQSKWHVRLPDSPTSFPREATFKLTRDESIFIQGRLEESCKGKLLSWLARNGSNELEHDHLWESSATSKASADIQEVIERARRFSLHVEGMPLLYNLLIAERRKSIGDSVGDIALDTKREKEYRQNLYDWASREEQEERYDNSGPLPLHITPTAKPLSKIGVCGELVKANRESWRTCDSGRQLCQKTD